MNIIKISNQNSFSFLWAGLGRMAGGAVTGGLQKAAFLFQDQTFTTKAMVLIGKAIFLDMAWQHEIFLADQQLAINMALENDARYHPIKSYAEDWKNIACQDQDKISEGNKMLLEIEQYNIIQPIYDKITEIGGPTVHHIVTALSSNIHPYHRPFLFVIPTGNVMNFNDRWRWIMEQQGMWEKWVVTPSEERDRLINTLSLDDLIIHNWGPTIPELLPHGALF